MSAPRPQSAWVFGFLMLCLAGASPAWAQVPRANVPAPLVGTWEGFFSSLGPVAVQLGQASATIVSDRQQRLGYLAGSLSLTEQTQLKVLWDLPAFQQGADDPLPASAWPAAVLDKGDSTYPGFVSTSVRLRYDGDKDELVGTYVSMEVDHDQGKYLSTKTAPVDIRLVRKHDVIKLAFAAVDPDVARPAVVPLQAFRVVATVVPPLPASAKISATIVNPRTAAAVSVALQARDKASGEVLSDPVLVLRDGSPAAGSLDAASIAARPGDRLRVRLDPKQAELAVNDDLEAPPKADKVPSYRLDVVGSNEVLVDPHNGQMGELKVRLSDTSGTPVPDVKIVWIIPDSDPAPVTPTDDDGTAKLGFVVTKDGAFIPALDHLPVGPDVRAGTYSITVAPQEAVIVGQLETKPIVFSATLKAPTTIQFVDESNAPLAWLGHRQDAYVRVHIAEGTEAPAAGGTLSVVIKDSRGGTIPVTLSPTPRRGLYQSKSAFSIVLKTQETTKLSTTFQGVTAELPVYPAPIAAAEASAQATLKQLYDIAVGARRAKDLPADVRAELDLKGKVLANALAWMQEPITSKPLRVAIASAYIQLATEAGLAELGQPIDRAPPQSVLPQSLKKTKLRYVCTAEERAINKAIQTGLYNTQKVISDAYWVALSAGLTFVLAPQIGLYTAISGRTIEGHEADTVERVAGVAAAVTALLPIGGAVARYASEAAALERLAANELRIVELSTEAAYREGALLQLSLAESKAVLTELTTLLSKPAAKELKLLQRAEQRSSQAAKIEEDVAARENTLATKKAELDTLLQQRREAMQAGRGTKTVSEQIRHKQNAIAKVEKSLPAKRARLQGLQREVEEITRDIDRLGLERDLQRQELLTLKQQGKLPEWNQKVNGVPVHKLYQTHVDGNLKGLTSAEWRGEQAMEIPVAYKQTNWGRDFFERNVNVKEVTVTPRPDHINFDPNNLQIADSKYWRDWPQDLSSQFAQDRVRQAVDTIEKARLVQYNAIRAQRAAAGQSVLFADVWSDVLKTEVSLVTPVEVPQAFQNLVRASVRGAGRNVSFTVLKIDLADWAAQLRPR